MTMLMPDFVLAVALEFERIGLSSVPFGCTAPALDPQTLWRIPTDSNVVALPPPSRKIRPQDIRILNARRAGNRGRANRKTTSMLTGNVCAGRSAAVAGDQASGPSDPQ
jgi:hypothetical protein